ncbi:MAG: domain signal receiver protein [Herbaspirillum sp.]|nr:domain signal receiver protein [Herbaspirillum sp.]
MNLSILLIEDNEQNRYLTTFLLNKFGHSVTSAYDGPSGIALALEQKFDLILLDIQLPGMDGYEVARTLRATPATEHIAIVAVTSYAMVGDRESILEAGCDGYLEKPIDPETFVTDITAYFTNKTGEMQNDTCVGSR